MTPNPSRIARRNFLGAAAATAGLGAVSTVAEANMPLVSDSNADRLPREVWIATISQEKMRARDHVEMSRMMLARMEEAASQRPDIIVLPEVFSFVNIDSGRPPLKQVAQRLAEEDFAPFCDFAKRHRCYVFTSTYTVDGGRYYNSAVLIDRQGRLQGAYHKMHPTEGEMDNGVSPGPLEPPVFKADFGVIGAQTCFDVEWDDGWRKLREAGAEIVFFNSAFAAGSVVNWLAARHQYVVVSSTRKDTSKICDVTGDEVAATGRWNHWVCSPVNLEKVLLHTWPYNQRFAEIIAKYGRKVRITNYHEEEWSLIESRSPEVKVADLLQEFELDTHRDLIARATRRQNAARA